MPSATTSESGSRIWKAEGGRQRTIAVLATARCHCIHEFVTRGTSERHISGSIDETQCEEVGGVHNFLIGQMKCCQRPMKHGNYFDWTRECELACDTDARPRANLMSAHPHRGAEFQIWMSWNVVPWTGAKKLSAKKGL